MVAYHKFDAIAVCSSVLGRAKMPKLPNQQRFTGKMHIVRKRPMLENELKAPNRR